MGNIDREIKTVPTIDDLRPPNVIDGYPVGTNKYLRKLAEVVPGLISWFFIFIPVIATILKLESVLLFYVGFLSIYWMIRGVYFTYGILIGYYRYKRDCKIDWMQKIDDEYKEEFSKIKYLYICPVVKEGLDILEPTMQSYANSDIPTKKIMVVFAFEEKFAEICIENYRILEKKYANLFGDFRYYVHPDNIEGEAAGVKGANINYATRTFVKEILQKGEKLEDYIVLTSDSDLRVHSKYISSITYRFLADPKKYRRFYASALYTFNNNIWDVPVLVRVLSIGLTFAILHAWVNESKRRETFSAYAVSLKTVDEVGYWYPDLGIDDSTFFYNALMRYNGDFSGLEVYVPTYNDAVQSDGYIATHRSLYKQQFRWGWGYIVIPISLVTMFYKKRSEMQTLKKLEITIFLIKNTVVNLSMVFVLTFALPVMGLISSDYKNSSAIYFFPEIISSVLSLVLLFTIPVHIIKRKISPPFPKGRFYYLRQVKDLLEVLLIVVIMLTFAYIPYIHAQTEMLLGKGFRKKYYVTEKVRTSGGSS